MLGIRWRNQFYIDLALPFGLRSTPHIFNSLAEIVEWILVNNYQIPNLLHYLDDFITAGPPDSPSSVCPQFENCTKDVRVLGFTSPSGQVHGNHFQA